MENKSGCRKYEEYYIREFLKKEILYGILQTEVMAIRLAVKSKISGEWRKLYITSLLDKKWVKGSKVFRKVQPQEAVAILLMATYRKNPD